MRHVTDAAARLTARADLFADRVRVERPALEAHERVPDENGFLPAPTTTLVYDGPAMLVATRPNHGTDQASQIVVDELAIDCLVPGGIGDIGQTARVTIVEWAAEPQYAGTVATRVDPGPASSHTTHRRVSLILRRRAA